MMTATAGDKSGTASVALASNGDGSSGLGTTSLPSQIVNVTGAAYRFAEATVNTASPVDFGIVHVGDTVEQAVSISNSAVADSYSESLNASVGTKTGDATGSGSFNLLAAGATESTNIKVGVDTTSAGSKSGNVSVGFVSDGDGTSGLGQTALASQQIQVQAVVNEYANPLFRKLSGDGTLTAGSSSDFYTLNFGSVARGSGAQIANLDILNDVSGPADNLGGVWIANEGAKFSPSGLVDFNNVVAGDSFFGPSIVFDTSEVGSYNGFITLQARSQNASGYDEALDDVTVSFSGTVFDPGSDLAVAEVQPNPMNLTNVHVGSLAEGTLTVSNVAAPGAESLNASFGTTDGDVSSATGSVTGLAAGSSDSTSMTVTMNTSSAGAKTGIAEVVLESDDGQGGTTPLPTEVVTVNVNVYRFAEATVPADVNIGNVHVGDVVLESLAVTNAAAADGFSESLNANVTGATGGATGAGFVLLLAAGETNNTDVVVGIDTSTAGVKSGVVTLSTESDGFGTSELGTTSLGSETVNVTGTVYRYAEATVDTTSSITFGVVHVGDTVEQAVGIRNSAVADGYSESLNASVTGTAGSATGSGSFDLLAAGDTNNTGIVVGIDTNTAGSKGGTVTVGFVSDGDGTSGLGQTVLAGATIGVQGLVLNYANPELGKTDGVGSLTKLSETEYALNLGTFFQNSGARQMQLSLFNAVDGPADWLEGSWTINVGDFDCTGFGDFNDLKARHQIDALVRLSSDALGVFAGTLTLSSTGRNVSGYEGAFEDIIVRLRGEVVESGSPVEEPVSEPAGLALLGLTLLGIRRRRRS
jgi:MYXO-CTERM domain-containing protein